MVLVSLGIEKNITSFFINAFERERERKRKKKKKRKRNFNCWLVPQVTAIARVGLDQTWEPKI